MPGRDNALLGMRLLNSKGFRPSGLGGPMAGLVLTERKGGAGIERRPRARRGAAGFPFVLLHSVLST